jgi:hypothetical protein
MIHLRISDDALYDLNEGFLFYEAQQSGLGDYFATCLRADIEGLRLTAGVHGVVYQDYHRLLSRVFPYGIFFSLSLRQTARDRTRCSRGLPGTP